MEQVAMSGVNFDHVEAGVASTDGGGLKGADDTVDFRNRERARDGVVVGERLGGRGHRLPSAVWRRDGAFAEPGRRGTGFPAGVRELDAGDGALRVHEVGNPSQPGHLFVGPDAEVLRTDSSLCRHRRGFGEDQRRPADGVRPEMHQVPIVGKTVDRRVPDTSAIRRCGEAG